MRRAPPVVVPPSVTAVLGSANRVRALATLANAYRPLTAYRVAKIARVPRTKVYNELRRLGRAGVVQERRGRGRRSTWVLLDLDLARYLRVRVRIAWSEDLARVAARRAAGEGALLAAAPADWFEPRDFPPDPIVAHRIRARDAAEVRRPEGKGEFVDRSDRVSRKFR